MNHCEFYHKISQEKLEPIVLMYKAVAKNLEKESGQLATSLRNTDDISCILAINLQAENSIMEIVLLEQTLYSKLILVLNLLSSYNTEI